MGTPFTVIETPDNKYTSCTGYFMQFYNSKDECPKKDDGTNVCSYSDNIRIKYYGGTQDTKKNARCGLKAVDNVIYTGDLFESADLKERRRWNCPKLVFLFDRAEMAL